MKALPVLSREEERELFHDYQGGSEEARVLLVKHNMSLVTHLCMKSLGDRDFLEDLQQEGLIGLLTAIEKFDLSRNIKFSTYATWWVRQKLAKYHERERLIKLPHLKAEKIKSVKWCRSLLSFMNPTVTDSDVAETLGIEEELVRDPL